MTFKKNTQYNPNLFSIQVIKLVQGRFFKEVEENEIVLR